MTYEKEPVLATFSWIETQEVTMQCSLRPSDLPALFGVTSQAEAQSLWDTLSAAERRTFVRENLSYLSGEEMGHETIDTSYFRELLADE